MAIIRVDNDAIGSNNGTSWNNAYTNLQDAIAAAQSGDEIWVAKGTYRPTNGTDRDVSFVLKDGVKMYGGFAGNETNLNQRNVGENETILSGDLGTQGNNQDNSYHVVNVSNTSDNSVLDGFTISEGNANNNGGGIYSVNSQAILSNLIVKNNNASSGGGIYAQNSDLQQITNVVFINNNATTRGGAIYSDKSDLIIDGTTFNGNYAENGGAIYTADSSNSSVNLEIKNSQFYGNLASGHHFLSGRGGAIYNSLGSPTIENVSFLNNGAINNGGAIYSSSGTPTIDRAIFKDNLAKLSGGGIYNTGTSSDTVVVNSLFEGNISPFGAGIYNDNINTSIVNNTFTNNKSRFGAAIRTKGSDIPNVANSIFWQNDSIVNSNPIANKDNANTTIANSSILEDPKFVNPDNLDFRLANDSPAVNTGDNNAIVVYNQDLAGNNRIAGNTVDKGAYEGLGNSAPVISGFNNGQVIYVDDTAIGGNNGNSWANAYTNLQDAIASASFGSQIWVAEGIYKPTSQTGEDAREISFRLKNGVSIYGGFAGNDNETLNDRDITNNLTILSGDIGEINDSSDNSHHVVNASYATNATILNGFTISDGNADDRSSFSIDGNGGGIYAYKSQAVFADLIIQNNEARSGGGIYVSNSFNQFINVNINENTADNDGGGIHLYDSISIFEDTVFNNNVARRGSGGAVYILSTSSKDSNLIVDGGLFTGNTAEDNGGAIAIPTSSANNDFNLNNAVFRDNTANNGGAIYNYYTDSSSTISNSIFDGNIADTDGGAIFNHSSSASGTNLTFYNNEAINGAAVYTRNNAPIYHNSIFWGNENTSDSSSNPIFNDESKEANTIVSQSIVESGYNGLGNISANPLFNNPEQGDFRLKGNSPAINAGLNDFIIEDTDLIGNSRIVNNRVDLGAYEYFAEQDLSSHPGTIGNSNILVSNALNANSGSALDLVTVRRFRERGKGFHLYTSDTNEYESVRQQSESGILNYEYEGEKFDALASNRDLITGETIEGVKPVYRFFNSDTGAHLYTMSEAERDNTLNTLDNYSLDESRYYAFEFEPENFETIPVYRMLNTDTGAHLFTVEQSELNNITTNLPNYEFESDNKGGVEGVTFYVLASDV